MEKTKYCSKSFVYNDLGWSDFRIAKAKEEAEAFCAEHNGEIEHIDGKPCYWRDGDPYYSDPESWPKYVVYWEETTEA